VRKGLRLGFRCSCPGAPGLEVSADTRADLARDLRCPACQAERKLHLDRVTAEGGLIGCLACGHPELYTRKSFPPAAGILVVVAAAALAPFTHYVSLATAALVDLALFRWVPDVVVCYVCRAEHRGFTSQPRHPRFDREIEERLLYGPRAVMGRPMREGGTAGAPDPEH
jgi:Zn ribbon nucleic-acid-binding protein